MTLLKKYRILPLGYSIIIFIILILVIIISISIRNLMPDIKLFYLLNSEFKSNNCAVNLNFEQFNRGDISEYKKHSYKINSNIYLDKKNVINLNTKLNINNYKEIEFDFRLYENYMLIKENSNNNWSKLTYKNLNKIITKDPNLDFELEKLIELLDLNDQKLKSIISSNLISTYSIFRKNIEYNKNNKNEIQFKITLPELISNYDSIINNVKKHKYFDEVIMNRVSELYRVYGSNPVIDYLGLDSTTMFSNLVLWNNNFATAVKIRSNYYKRLIINNFEESSHLMILITFNKSEIISTNINIILDYKDKNVTEVIKLDIRKIEYLSQNNIDDNNIVDFNSDNFYSNLLSD